MSRTGFVAVALLAFTAGHARAQSVLLTPSSPVSAFADAMQKSAFVFSALTDMVGGSTTASVPASSATTIVKVRGGTDIVYTLPQGFFLPSGKRFTVVTPSAGELSSGTAYLMFATLAASDSGTAIGLVARAVYTQAQRAALVQRLSDAAQLIYFNTILGNVTRATVAVAGLVQAITPLDSLGKADVQEHSPRWVRATVRVEGSFKGTLPVGSIITVVFPGTRDRTFGDSPRLQVGQREVFLLRPVSLLPASSRVGLTDNGWYFVIDPGDVLARKDSTFVKQAVR